MQALLIDLSITTVEWLGKGLTTKWATPVIPRDGETIVLPYSADESGKVETLTLKVLEVRYYPLPERIPRSPRELDHPNPTCYAHVFLNGTRVGEELAEVACFGNPHRLDWRLVRPATKDETFKITPAGQQLLDELPEMEPRN